MIFDTHAHYTDEQFEDRDILLPQIHKEGVSEIITCGTDIKSSIKSIELSKKYPFVYAAVGFHPEELTRIDVDIPALKNLINERVVAIGEIGLDYYWNKENKEKQKDGFIRQILLAKELGLPVIVHDREAHGDTLEILKEYKPKGVLHCFSGSTEMAKEIIKLGMYIGVGGVVTFKNSKKIVEVIKEIPLERILLETDAPYLAPEPFRGKINRSDYIEFVAKKIAEIKNVDYEQVLLQTTENTKKLFNI
jgi:TatD DNase family protein